MATQEQMAAEFGRKSEAQILSDVLRSTSEGGGALAGGTFGEGADVPNILANDRVARQLLEEQVATQKGKAPAVVTADRAMEQTRVNQERLAEMTAPIEPTPEVAPLPEAPAQQEPLDPLAQQLRDAQEALEIQARSYTEQLDAFGQRMDAASQAQIAAIQATYARRKEEMKLLNKATLGAQTKAGIRSGRQRYATEIQTSILSAEEAAGIGRLADLDAQEQALIAEAKMANDANKLGLLSKKMEQLTQLHQMKVASLKDQQQLALQQEQLAMDKAREVREQLRFEREGERFAMEETRFLREEAEARASTMAANIFDQLTGDPEADRMRIESMAAGAGMEADMLFSSVDAYRQDYQRNALATKQMMQGIAAGIPEGQVYSDEKAGIYITGTQEPESINVVETRGNTNFQVRYKLVDGELQEVFRINLGPRVMGGSGGGRSTKTPANSAFMEMVSELNAMKGTPAFNDTVWAQYVNSYAREYDLPSDQVSSDVARAMEVMAGGGMYDAPIMQEAPVSYEEQYATRQREAIAPTKRLMENIYGEDGAVEKGLESLAGLFGF